MAGTDHLLLSGSVVHVQLAVSLSNRLGGSTSLGQQSITGGFHNLPVQAWLGRWAATDWENGAGIIFLSPGIGRSAKVAVGRDR